MTATKTGGDGPPLRGLVALLGLAAVMLVVMVVAIVNRTDEPAVQTPTRAPGGFRGNQLPAEVAGSRAPNFKLRDARGGAIDTRALRGRPYVVTFLYTECPDVCPLIGQELRVAFEKLGPRATEVAAVAVSVDPEGDTAEAVRTWLDRQRLPDNFRYGIGSERELKPVWDSYYAAAQIPGDPESTHSASIWLIDGRGRIRTKFSAGFPVEPADIAHDLRLLLDER